jgi:hypothetical protein
MNHEQSERLEQESGGPASRQGLRLLDLAALVVGYSMAALLVRAFWPASVAPQPTIAAALGLEYLWLGLAMSGPFVLALDRRRRADREAAAQRVRPGYRIRDEQPLPARDPAARYTGPELAWLLIGGYWICMTILLVPSRPPGSSAALLGLLPFLAGAGLSILGPKRGGSDRNATAWTHRAAVVLLWTWPLAWIGLIALTQVL